jgi:hypothetical protein
MYNTDTISNLYVVTREGEACVFRPSALFANLMVAGFAAGGAPCLYPAVVFLPKADDSIAAVFVSIFGFAAALMAALAVRAWRTRRTPLIVEPAGRVCYGEQELCAVGTVRAVRIAPSPGGDAGACEVCLEQAEGRLVPLPSQYFAGLGAEDQARPFAAALAAALGVQVSESAS